MTDEYRAYEKLIEKGYDHLSVNHSGGEYASGSNICECRVGRKWQFGENIGGSANGIWSHT